MKKDNSAKNLLRLQEGEFIRKQRKLNGLSQMELADQLGISQSKLSKIEKGMIEIGIREWFIFCDVHSIDVAQFRNFIR